MTYEQNVKAILESNFAGFKEEIIDIACKRICMLETKEEIIDRVLEIIDNTRWDKEEKQIERAWNHACGTIRLKVLVLKGEQE